ncbi:MAG: hypothetical protein K2Z81_27375, partial [Cyanobacteria bacterium]|nr:hypothetical protein [Cyanobacteriota bacterium]
PSVVARVTADALLQGRVNVPGADPLVLDDHNRRPSSPQSISFPRLPDERSFASQLFQLASMNALGRQPEIRDTHLYYTNRWRQNERDFPEIGPCARLEFVQRRETAEVWEKNKAGVEELRYIGPRRREDPHPYLLNNGMEVYAVNERGERVQCLTQITPGKERKDGGNHILMQAYGTQSLLNLLDPGVHRNCVFAHRDMIAYTRQGPGADKSGPPASRTAGEMVSFNDVADLRKRVLEAKAAGNLPIVIASVDFAMARPFHRMNNPLEREFEATLDECDNTHIMIIRDIVPGDPAKGTEDVLVTDDFFGKAYDRRFLPKSEWEMYFMRNTRRANR